MKKTIKPMLAVGLFLLLLTNSCRKNDLSTITAAEQAVVTAQQAAKAGNSHRGGQEDEPPADYPSALVNISEELFAALASGNHILIEPASEGVFDAIGVVNEETTGGPDAPYCPGAMAEYHEYRAEHDADFQQWADENCTTFVGYWSHSCGLNIMFWLDPVYPWICPQDAYNYNSQIPVKVLLPE